MLLLGVAGFCRSGRVCIDSNGGGEKKKREMEGLVMRKVRERLCLIVCGGGVGGDEGMVGRGPELSSVGLLLLQPIFMCVCVYVSGGGERKRKRERERAMRRYEIQLRCHYFLLTRVMRLKEGLEPQTFIMRAHCHI